MAVGLGQAAALPLGILPDPGKGTGSVRWWGGGWSLGSPQSCFFPAQQAAPHAWPVCTVVLPTAAPPNPALPAGLCFTLVYMYMQVASQGEILTRPGK